ncbi:TolC family outer membrane protein [Aquincola sp. S2]|uniref:TolC family outer membrane protein n=1 Tax=Pseudaquabacterium terrae TaxID=2732868 RepID=A0ABX2EEW3_9BURK|nr:TolC family outer membrane protein [Aquabacterium terrae]NRF67147.1 TolC family outer membrane protein [Aquabacterium terrae]
MPSQHQRPPAPRLRTIILALGMLAAATAQAQSLKELYDAAHAYDATYLAAKALADSAQYKAAQAEALRRPVVALAGSATRTEIDPVAGSNLSANTGKVEVNARHPLFNRANAATIDQAYRALDVAKADLEIAEQDLIVRVSQGYFDVLAAQDTLATARANRTGISEQLASAKRNFEVGTATITDTREAQARFDLATAQEIAADNDLRTKRIALDQLVGRTGIAPKPLAVPVALPPLGAPDPEEWVLRADTQHPLVRKARLGLDIAKLETAKARAGHLPTVDLIGSVGNTRETGSAASIGGGRPGTTRNATVGVQLNYTLYAGNSIQNRVSETTILEEKARNDLEASRRGVAQATRQTFYGAQSLQAQVKALEAAESSSKLALEATQLGYRVGVRVNLDVLNAQTQLFTTQRDLAKARYDTVMTSLRLRQAAGQLNPQDVQAVDALLAR